MYAPTHNTMNRCWRAMDAGAYVRSAAATDHAIASDVPAFSTAPISAEAIASAKTPIFAKALHGRPPRRGVTPH